MENFALWRPGNNFSCIRALLPIFAPALPGRYFLYRPLKRLLDIYLQLVIILIAAKFIDSRCRSAQAKAGGEYNDDAVAELLMAMREQSDEMDEEESTSPPHSTQNSFRRAQETAGTYANAQEYQDSSSTSDDRADSMSLDDDNYHSTPERKRNDRYGNKPKSRPGPGRPTKAATLAREQQLPTRKAPPRGAKKTSSGPNYNMAAINASASSSCSTVPAPPAAVISLQVTAILDRPYTSPVAISSTSKDWFYDLKRYYMYSLAVDPSEKMQKWAKRKFDFFTREGVLIDSHESLQSYIALLAKTSGGGEVPTIIAHAP